jgi:hypothetical protein
MRCCIRHLREGESKTCNRNDSDRNIECIKPTMERRIDLCGAVGRMNLKPANPSVFRRAL